MTAGHSRPSHPEGAEQLPTHLTWATRWRIPHFADEDVAWACLDALEHERRRIALPVFAYALMPDHFHLVIGPSPMRLGYVVHALKNASVHRLKVARLSPGGLWQEGYWDTALRTSADIRRAMSYVHNNPVVAGLTQDATRYPFSSLGAWEGLVESRIRLAATPELLKSIHLDLI